MCDSAVGELQQGKLKEFESKLSQPPTTDELLSKTEQKQTAIGVGAEMESTVSKGNPENSDGESILVSPEVLKFPRKETCETSEICEVDDSLHQAGQEVTKDKNQMENANKFQIVEKAGIGEGEVIKAMEGGEQKIDPNQYNLDLAATYLMKRSFGDSSVNLGESEGLKEEKILNQLPEVIAAKDAPLEEAPEAIDEQDSASIDVPSVDDIAPTLQEILDHAPSITTRDKQATTESSDKMKSLDEDNKQGNAADKGILKDDPLVEVKSSISIIDENVENFEVKSLPEATPVLSGEDKDWKGEDAGERNNNITEEEVNDGPGIKRPAEATKEIIKDNDMLPLPKLNEGERFESFKDDENEAEKSKQEDDTECVTEVGQNEDLRLESAEEVSDQNFQVDEKESDKFEGEKLEKSEAAARESIESKTSQTAESPQERLSTLMMRQDYNLQIEDKSTTTTEALLEEKGNDNELGETEGPNEKKILQNKDSKILQESEPGEKLEHSLHLTPEETERIPSEADKIPSLMEGVLQNPGESLEEEVTGEADNNRVEENGTKKEDLKLGAETSDASKNKESIISEKETKVGKLEVEAFTKAYNLESEEKPECGDRSDLEVNTQKEEAEEGHEGAKIDDREEDTGQSIINDESHIGDSSLESVGEESCESHQGVKIEEKMPEVEVQEPETTNTSEDAEKHTFEEKEEETSKHQSTLLAAKIEEGSKEENTVQIMTEKEENQATHKDKDIDTQKTEDGSNKAGDNFEVPAIETDKEESDSGENKEREPEKEVYEAFKTADSGTGKENLSIDENDEDFSSSTKDEIVKEISKVSNSNLALTRDTEETGSVEKTTPQTTEDRPEPKNDQCTLDIAKEGKEEKTPEEMEEGLIQNSSFESEVSKDTEKERTNMTDSDSLSLAAAIEETKVKEAEPEDKTEIGGSDVPLEEKGLAAIETKGIELGSEDINAKEDSNSFEKDKEISTTAVYETQDETSNTGGEHQKEVTTRESPLKEILEGHLKEYSEVPLDEHAPTSSEATETNETSEKIQDPCETSETHSMSHGVEEMLVQKEDNSSNPLAVPVLGTIDMGEGSVDKIKKHTGEDQELHSEQSTETYISRTEDAEVSRGEETREEGECEKPIDETVNCNEPSGIREDGEADIEEPENYSTNLVGCLKGSTDVEKEATEVERSDSPIHEVQNVNEEPSQVEEVKDYFQLSTENEEGDKTDVIERGTGAVHMPREQSAEDTDKDEKSPTMEDLDETPSSHPERAESESLTSETLHAVELGKDILASDAVYEPQDKVTEKNVETRESTIEETEGGLESQYAKQDDITFEKALPEAKSEEQLQTPSPRLPSQNKEIETTTIEKEKEKQQEDMKTLESGSPEDFSDAKTTEEVCLRSEEQREPKVVLEDDITVCQGVPAEKPVEKIQTPSLLPSEEQECQKTNMDGKTEQDKIKEATIMLDQTTDDHSDANTGDDVTTTVQTLMAQKSDEQIETTSSVSLTKEQESETAVSIEKTEDKKTADTGILEDESPEDSSETKKTKEICSIQEEPQELEGDQKDENAAAQSLLVEKSKEQIPAPSSTLPSEELEHGTTTKVDEMEEERVNEDKGPIEVEGVAEREVIAGAILPADESEEIKNTKSVEKEAEKLEDESHEDSSMAVVQHELTDGQTISAEKTKQQAQEEEQEAMTIAKIEDDKERAEIIEDENANSNAMKDLCLKKDSTEPETVEETEITADQTSIEEKSEEQSQSAISALPSNEQKCDDATRVENTEGQVFSAEESEQQVQGKEHEAVITSKMVEDDKKEEATTIDDEGAEDAKDSKTMEDLCQQKEPTEPKAVTEDEITADQAPVEKKAVEHIQIATSALTSSSKQECEGATEVENTDGKTFSAEKSEQLVQEKEHEMGIIGEKIEDNKIEGAEIVEHENTKDASDSNIMTDLSQQKESTEPEAVIEDKITADQTLMEEKLEEQIQNAISALPSKDEEFEGATTVENTDGQTFSAEKSEQQVQEEHGAVIIAKNIEDDKKAGAEIIEHEGAGDASDMKTMEDLCQQKEPTEPKAVTEDEITADQAPVEKKAEEHIQIATSALAFSSKQECEGATEVENTDGKTFSAEKSEQLVQEKEHEMGIIGERIEGNKIEGAETVEHNNTKDASDSNIMKDLSQQKESTEPEAVIENKITADQTLMEEKSKEQIQNAISALPSKDMEFEGATTVENTDGQTFSAEKSEQQIQEEHEAVIIAKNIEDDKKAGAEIIEHEGAGDASDIKTMEDLCQQKEPTEPKAVTEDEITADQAPVEKKAEEHIQIATSALPSSSKQECEGATEVENTDGKTFSAEKSEQLVQEKEHEMGIIGEIIEGNKIEGAETVEHENTKDASDSNIMTDLSQQKESTEPEAVIEDKITADQTLMEEKSEEQIQNAIYALPSKDTEFEGATTVENTDGQTFSAEKSEQQIQEEHEAVIIAKNIEDDKKAGAEIIERESAGDASHIRTMEDLCPQKESTESEAVIENETTADQTVLEEKSEEKIQIASSSLPPKEVEFEGATLVEDIKEGKIKETENLEGFDAKRAEDVLLEKGMLQEFEAVVRKEEITSQKKEEEEILEDESAEDAKTMRDLCSQKESTELETALDNKVTIDPTVVEEKPEEQVQIATHALPSEEQECKGATIVENIEEEKTKKAEILEQDILLQKERLQVSKAVRQDEIESAQGLTMESTEQQLTTPSHTLPSEEEEHGTATKVNKIEEETMEEEEILEKDSSAGKPEEKGAEDISLAKEKLQELEGVRKNEVAFAQTPMTKLEEQLQAPSSKLVSEEEEEEHGTKTGNEKIGEEKLKELEMLEREYSAAKSTEEKRSEKEGPKEFEDVMNEEIIADQTLPAEESQELETKRAVQKVEELKKAEKLEDESCENASYGTKTKEICFQMEEPSKLQHVAKDEIAAVQTFSAEHSEELQISAPALSSEGNEKTIEGDEPKKNGDSSEKITEDKEVVQTMKASDQEDQLKDGFLGAEENNATFKTTAKDIQTEEMSVEIQKVDGNKNVEKIQAEDRSLKDTDNTSSVAMTETKTIREEESGVATSQMESSTEKTANEASDEQIPREVDMAESSRKPASTGTEIGLLEKLDRVAETFRKGEEITTKETPSVTKEMTKERERTTSKKKSQIEEADEGEEGNKRRKMDSDPDSPVMVEAPTEKENIRKVPPKKSHNILSGVGSRVKHSISKVKKAFICASPNVVNPKSSEKRDV
ncbi:hypothetical protein SLE2022_280740 [Rubroshorea leprosula]